jgi:hypothetical protein
VASVVNRMVTVGILNMAVAPVLRRTGTLIASLYNYWRPGPARIHTRHSSLHNEFTYVFYAKHSSVLIPAHSGFVLHLGATDYPLGYFFLRDAVI